MTGALDQLLFQAKALALHPRDPAYCRSAVAEARSYVEHDNGEQPEGLHHAVAGICWMIKALAHVEDRSAQASLGASISAAVDAIRAERSRIVSASIKAREPRRHWGDGARADA